MEDRAITLVAGRMITLLGVTAQCIAQVIVLTELPEWANWRS